MYRIAKRRELNPSMIQLEVEAPMVARKAQPGQFIILRVDEEGERIPLTIAGTDPEAGTVKIIFQVVGATTEQLKFKQEGEYLQDFAGPLGRPTETEGKRNVCIMQANPFRQKFCSRMRLRKNQALCVLMEFSRKTGILRRKRQAPAEPERHFSDSRLLMRMGC